MAVDKFMCVNVDVIVVYYKVDRLLNSLYGMWTSMEVKIRGPEQGLGLIKKWGSGTDPRSQKIMLWDQSLTLLVL